MRAKEHPRGRSFVHLITFFTRLVSSSYGFGSWNLCWIFHITATWSAVIFAAGLRYPYHIGITGLFCRRLCYRFGRLCCFGLWSRTALRSGAVTGGIINGYAGLNIVAINIKANSFTAVFNRIRFYLNAAAHKVVPLINRRDPVCNMMVCFLDVVGNHILKGQHTLNVHISGAGYQVLSVRILRRELPSD